MSAFGVWCGFREDRPTELGARGPHSARGALVGASPVDWPAIMGVTGELERGELTLD